MSDDLTTFLLARIAEDQRDWQALGDQYEALNGALRSWPARVLAECEAKRRIIAAVTDWLATHAEEDHVTAGDDALAWLALPYADHPDYDEAWSPR